MKYRVFISSVQDEFTAERRGLKEYLTTDALLREYVEDVFLFEDIPAARRKPGDVYLHAVEDADIFIGIYGCRYGYVFPDGTSPTEREYDAAAKRDIPIWLFYYDKDATIDARMTALRRKIDASHTRREVHSTPELFREVYNAFISLLRERRQLFHEPFDVSEAKEATMADIDGNAVEWFAKAAIKERGFSDVVDVKEVSTDFQGLNEPTRKTSVKIGVKTGKKTGEKTGEKTGLKSRLKTSDAIVELMRVNPMISHATLSKMLDRALSSIMWQIAKLKKTGIIRRIGPDKGGHWEVVE